MREQVAVGEGLLAAEALFRSAVEDVVRSNPRQLSYVETGSALTVMMASRARARIAVRKAEIYEHIARDNSTAAERAVASPLAGHLTDPLLRGLNRTTAGDHRVYDKQRCSCH